MAAQTKEENNTVELREQRNLQARPILPKRGHTEQLELELVTITDPKKSLIFQVYTKTHQV
jgi:hypothetical protein